MTAAGWFQLAALGLLIALSTRVLGAYMFRVYFTKRAPGDRFFLPIERAVYRACGIDPDGEQRWNAYALSLLAFSLVSCLLTYFLLRLQGHLPFNPDGMATVQPGLSFNTAVSFLTGTNWQSYAGEHTMSHFSQMVALVVQQFLAGAAGMAVAVALIRGLTRKQRWTLGSFWVDLVRSITRVLLPITIAFAVVLMSQGVIQNFHATRDASTVSVQSVDGDGTQVRTQNVPGGPVASMTPIELVGTNGGGFFNANLAHPFENPNPLTNLLLYWLAFMIPFALAYTFGRAAGAAAQGRVVLAAMGVLLVATTAIGYAYEGHGNPQLARGGASQTATRRTRAPTWKARSRDSPSPDRCSGPRAPPPPRPRRTPRQLTNVLRHGQFEVRAARDLPAAGRQLRRQTFVAVVISDLVGPDLRDVVRELRTRTEVPIIVVSCAADEWDKVVVFDAGADDYLVPPYGIEEFLARLRAAMRRFERAAEEVPIVTEDFTVYVRDRRLVKPDGSEAPLTATEWKILEVLLRHPGHLVSHADLLRAVWGPDAVGKTGYLRVHMVSIRRKVEPEPSDPRYLVTAPGLGLRSVLPEVVARGSAS